MLTATGTLFTCGVACFLWDFFRQIPVRATVEPAGDPVPSPSVA
jgi:hypothetical protein